MKNKNLEKLVAALRSGKYKQGTGRLNNNNEFFCCLGVACEVAIENGIHVNKNTQISSVVLYNGCTINLPINVREFFGLYSTTGSNKLQPISLVELNDIEKKSFNQIADYIEQNEDKLTK